MPNIEFSVLKCLVIINFLVCSVIENNKFTFFLSYFDYLYFSLNNRPVVPPSMVSCLKDYKYSRWVKIFSNKCNPKKATNTLIPYPNTITKPYIWISYILLLLYFNSHRNERTPQRESAPLFLLRSGIVVIGFFLPSVLSVLSFAAAAAAAGRPLFFLFVSILLCLELPAEQKRSQWAHLFQTKQNNGFSHADSYWNRNQ